MAATAQDLTIWQGDEISIAFTIEDDAGAAQNIAGATFSWVISRSLDHAPALDTIAGTIIDAPTGRVDIPLATSTTENLEGAYKHELVMTAGGKARTVAVGVITIKASLPK